MSFTIMRRRRNQPAAFLLRIAVGLAFVLLPLVPAFGAVTVDFLLSLVVPLSAPEAINLALYLAALLGLLLGLQINRSGR